MPGDSQTDAMAPKRSLFILGAVLVAAGSIAFFTGILGGHPQRAWHAYLINFLLWSAIAQGAVLFSAVIRLTKARWSGPLSGLSEAFSGFFPLSFVLFLVLFLGRSYIFPWLHEDLHGKEAWLNLPFLFTRNAIGLLILYGIGFAYLRCMFRLKFGSASQAAGTAESRSDLIGKQATFLAGLYAFAYALVLCLIGYDLVMSMDPHWYSTLFGAYHFVKAFYVGLGGVIILAAIICLLRGKDSGLSSTHFHDIGKLFFAFCLLWADFFYVQLTVIWYGNIPEETQYVILRTVLPPWRSLAWTVFILAFIIPFIVLLNKRVKTKPGLMLPICTMVIVAMWLEHHLLMGPAWNHESADLQLGITEGLIFAGFLGLMLLAVAYMLKIFPALMPTDKRGI